ncbi:MAG: DNA ligase-associated DEXH box helicase, partial [Planctomycetota bacterium]
MGIGTITGDGQIAIAMRTGRRLGTVEENFISKLRPGDFFTFAGRPLELVGIRQMQAIVKPSSRKKGKITTWGGSRFPLSTMLANIVLDRLGEARQGVFNDEEMQSIAPLLGIQQRWSHLPARGELLVELINDREGGHVFFYPFLGRLVHEGLGALVIHRIARTRAAPSTASFNDYGIELVSTDPLDLSADDWLELLSPENLTEDLLACLNSGELTKRQFRDISRVAGLLLNTSPGAPRSTRQLQASSELFYEVFTEFDPDNLLLQQARREVLEQQLEVQRLRDALEQLGERSIHITRPKRLTPMAFPLWASRIQSQTIRVEAAAERIARVMARLEKVADG